MPSRQVKRVLVYRLGSIGDFVVALPCLHLIRKCFPTQQIGLLTNCPAESLAAPAQSVLENAGLIDEYLTYPLRTRNVGELGKLVSTMRSFRPDLFVYLAPRPRLSLVVRDYLFFRLSGASRMVGFPFNRTIRFCAEIRPGFREPEARRLARCISALGDAEADQPVGWSLRLTASEIAAADEVIRTGSAEGNEGGRFIGLSLGTKQSVNDWGDENWRMVLRDLNDSRLGVVLIGAAADRERSSEVSRDWSGPVINACGQLNPRQSAALIKRMDVLFCHDSGPMHLAAAVGTPCIAVFSTNNPPGQWFPFGSGHHNFYPVPPETSITSIKPVEIAAAARHVLAESSIMRENGFGRLSASV